MISVSFFLRTPDAKEQSQVYVSISDKTNRLRFPTGESFLTQYCNVRGKKGTKELVKKNTPFYFKYSTRLREIRDELLMIEMELKSKGGASLEQIKARFAGRRAGDMPLSEAIDKFIAAHKWKPNTKKKVDGAFNHLKAFEAHYPLSVESFSLDTWKQLRDVYFVGKVKISNISSNKNLEVIKQFLSFCKKTGILKTDLDFSELKYLEEPPDVFNISLKDYEVEALINLDLSKRPGLDRVRDLFILEILTGQRFSDVGKLLDKEHLKGTSIQIYQEKTGEVATIPIHPRLKKHLLHIFEKYPEGLPVISNQKFNDYLKETCKLAGFNKRHSWITLVGNEKKKHEDFRYNLITSHTGRRTFCTLARKRKINDEDIMKVSGHRDYKQFLKYVKVDDEDLEKAFELDLLTR